MNIGVYVPFLLEFLPLGAICPAVGLLQPELEGQDLRVASCIERVSYFTVFLPKAFLISNHGTWKYGRKWWPSAVVVSLKQSNQTFRT